MLDRTGKTYAELRIEADQRRNEILKMRESGHQWKYVAEKFQISMGRASKIAKGRERCDWKKVPEDIIDMELSARGENCLLNTGLLTKQEIIDAVLCGKIKPNKFPRNMGWKTYREICERLDLTPPKKTREPKLSKIKICPHCGGEL